MKKYILFILLLLVVSSCVGDSDTIKQAKQDMGIIENNQGLIEEKEVVETPIEREFSKGNDPRIRITQISGEQILELSPLNYSEFKKGYSKIEGKTLTDVESISVLFSNEESEYPDDAFTLKKFTSGDANFEYNASAKFKVLDFGVNTYLFTAKTTTTTSVLKLEIVVSENDERVLTGNSSILTPIVENIVPEQDVLEILPSGGEFGDIRKIGERAFTYSDIKGLEIIKEGFETFSCDNNGEDVTSFLSKRQKSWYYWNTCRDIQKGKDALSFFVTRLDGEKYFYEKHYIDFTHGLYGIYELESGGSASSENLSQKNKDLKEINANFTQLEVTDRLFKKIIQ